MKESKQYSKKFSLLILFVTSVILMLLSNLVIGVGVRNTVSYMYTPVAFAADGTGRNISNYLIAFKNITQLKTENEDLKTQLALLKSQQAKQILTDEENSQLKTLLKITTTNVKYIKGEIMSYEGLSGMILNKGKNDGVELEKAVITDNLFIGMINSLDNYSSSIKTIYDKSSSIKVMIVNKKEGTTNLKDVVKKHSFVNAVMIGNGDVVKVENIPINKGIRNGDIVVTNDDRIGQYIVVGEIKDLTTDLAVSTLNAQVKSYEDFSQFKFVFVLSHD
jgi:rod shape-determining protein MreC